MPCILYLYLLYKYMFRQGWAHHSLRTENNKTPLQLWIMGIQSITPSNEVITGLNVSQI